MTASATGRVLLNGEDHGSGFAIADSLAVTAGHVVWREKIHGGGHRPAAGPSGPALVYLVDRGEAAAVPAVVEYQPTGAEPIPVTRIQVSTGLDVAVLHLQRPASAVLPAAGHSRPESSGGSKPGRILKPQYSGARSPSLIAS